MGEHPDRVDPRFEISAGPSTSSSEHGIGRFRDIEPPGPGINRLNQAGGAILDDHDNNDRLDIVFTSVRSDPGDGLLPEQGGRDVRGPDQRGRALATNLAGIYCVQADYNNDGFLDIYIPRGGLAFRRRCAFDAVAEQRQRHLHRRDPASRAARSDELRWSRGEPVHDNDGFLDLFVCNETGTVSALPGNGAMGRSRRSRPQAEGENTRMAAGRARPGSTSTATSFHDLFLNNHNGTARACTATTAAGRSPMSRCAMGIDGPQKSFSCWAFDYDNDGWPDIFATSYDRTVEDVVETRSK